ncbi:MAG: thiamine-phosphate kinase, partial [Marinobacter sp.]
GVAARLSAARIPRGFGASEASLEQALCGGDDYELCVTLPGSALSGLPGKLAEQLQVIGEIRAGAGLQLEHPDGTLEDVSSCTGYDHFRLP